MLEKIKNLQWYFQLTILVTVAALLYSGVWYFFTSETRAEVATLTQYASARRVMAFAATAGEPDTDSLFARLERDTKTLVLPSMQDGRIVPRLVGAGLVAGAHGILSPRGEAVDPETIDLVIVPGLAFTTAGARLGRGGGHYDRFLPTLRRGCSVVGVCFAEQLLDELPCEPHDGNMDVVVVDPLTA